jgi:hypothetical protein
VHAITHLGGEPCEVLAQVQPWQHVAHRVLPRAHVTQRGGCRQPGRQRLFSRPGARCAEQLEQRASPEHVEVAGIQVRLVQEPLAGVAAARPPVLQPRQALVIERGGSLRPET